LPLLGITHVEQSLWASYCCHGDFINGWLPVASQNMLLAKMNSTEDRGVINGKATASKPVDADPDNGPPDYKPV
jgi:hypothetical protein